MGSETRIKRLEDHTEKTDPVNIRVFILWYGDNPDWVEFTPPGASGVVRLPRRDFEKQYSPEQRAVITVRDIPRPAGDDPNTIRVSPRRNDAWPDDAED